MTSIYHIHPRVMTEVDVSATVGMSATVGEMSATMGEMSVTVFEISATVGKWSRKFRSGDCHSEICKDYL